MSPEQARGEAIDHRSDLFSLGSVLYAMCTGRSPFPADTTFGVLRRITDNVPRPIREINSEIPRWLEVLVERSLAKDPRERFQSAEQLGQRLEACLAHWQQPTRFPLPAELRTRRLRRPGLVWLAAAAGFLAAGLLALVIARHRWDEGQGSLDAGRAATGTHTEAADAPGQNSSADLPAVGDWGDDDAVRLLEIEYELGRLEEQTRVPPEVTSTDSAKTGRHTTIGPTRRSYCTRIAGA